ncbi:MAG: DUF922 domain-containing Zn-dependent protease [Desulfobulbaceae bacterium]|nr:DUF922 domain-containing Zn-dependent protease [Desulfobulbaceae bacterium]
METTITFPEAQPAANPRLAEVFVPYLAALHRHELGQHQLAAAGRRVDETIRTLPPMSQCSALDASANARGLRILEELRRQNRQYDLDTQHGRTQVAWIPRGFSRTGC